MLQVKSVSGFEQPDSVSSIQIPIWTRSPQRWSVVSPPSVGHWTVFNCHLMIVIAQQAVFCGDRQYSTPSPHRAPARGRRERAAGGRWKLCNHTDVPLNRASIQKSSGQRHLLVYVPIFRVSIVMNCQNCSKERHNTIERGNGMSTSIISSATLLEPACMCMYEVQVIPWHYTKHRKLPFRSIEKVT